MPKFMYFLSQTKFYGFQYIGSLAIAQKKFDFDREVVAKAITK